jgi:hypothetical protein
MVNAMETITPAHDGQHDFDFLFGKWRVHNRRLDDPLHGSEWNEFGTLATVHPLWNGKGNIDEFIGETTRGPFEGATLRLYDANSGLWSLYWSTPQNGLTTVPNIGAFGNNGVGDFFSHEIIAGKPILCRYRWTQRAGEGCRWEQAFSLDYGRSWKSNWTMDFTRL